MTATFTPETASTASIRSSQTAEPSSEPRTWTTGAIIGPVLGITFVSLSVWFFFRLKKKASRAPQHGTALMAHIDTSQPPTGVACYADTSPMLASSPPGYHNLPGQSDPYARQGHPQQGMCSSIPRTASSPHHGFQFAYNISTHSPSPCACTHDFKFGNPSGAAELSGESCGIVSVAPAEPEQSSQNRVSTLQAVELSCDDIKAHEDRPSSGTEI